MFTLFVLFSIIVFFSEEEMDVRFAMTFWRGNTRELREIIAVLFFFFLCWIHKITKTISR